MSYDLELGVKVEGAKDLWATVAIPEFDNPTYNVGTMFRKCTGWDFKQSEWYAVPDVLPLIEHGISELHINTAKYKEYEAENGWGTVHTAQRALESLRDCIYHTVEYEDIPIEYLWVRW